MLHVNSKNETLLDETKFFISSGNFFVNPKGIWWIDLRLNFMEDLSLEVDLDLSMDLKIRPKKSSVNFMILQVSSQREMLQ